MSENAKGRRIIVLGALSAMAEATARLHAAEGAQFVLVDRDKTRLEHVAGDLRARGAAQCSIWNNDLSTVDDAHDALAKMADALGGPVDVLYLFYGVLGDQGKAETSTEALRRQIGINFTSAAGWCVAGAGILERQKSGTLVAISSVAGDRGRMSNYVYGAAKAGLSALVQGIAHRLAKSGGRAIVIKPGFVDTPMTDHLDKSGFLWVKPERVARVIKTAVDHGRGPIVYAPSFWRWIMLIIRFLPASIFHKTNL